MQRNQRISSRSAIPTRERLASRERECTWQTSWDEERLTIPLLYCEKSDTFRADLIEYLEQGGDLLMSPLLYDGEAPPTLGNLAERNWRKSVGCRVNHRTERG